MLHVSIEGQSEGKSGESKEQGLSVPAHRALPSLPVPPMIPRAASDATLPALPRRSRGSLFGGRLKPIAGGAGLQGSRSAASLHGSGNKRGLSLASRRTVALEGIGAGRLAPDGSLTQLPVAGGAARGQGDDTAGPGGPAPRVDDDGDNNGDGEPKTMVEGSPSPQSFLRAVGLDDIEMAQLAAGNFVYLRPRGGTGAGSYDLEVCDAQSVDSRDYMTLSHGGVTRFVGDTSDFTPL